NTGGYACRESSVSVIDGSTNSVVNTIQTPGCAHFIGINENLNKIYVTTGAENTTYVINGSTDTATLVPLNIFFVGINPNTSKIYGTDSDTSSQIDIINGVTDTMIKTLSIPSTLASSLVVNPDTNMIYASNPSYPYQVIV